jgi:uncharacterized protein YjbI with pentapeptide repeats
MRDGVFRAFSLVAAIVFLTGCPGSKYPCDSHICPGSYVCEEGFEEDCDPNGHCPLVALCVCGHGSAEQGGRCVDACALETWIDKATHGCKELAGADLTGAALEGALLIEAKLNGATLQNADLDKANLSEADLTGADLTGASMEEAYLQWANLTNAVLVDANLSSANLDDTRLDGADFTGATFAWLRAHQVVSCPASLPLDWACLAQTLVGPSAGLYGVELSNQDLSERNLRDTIFQNAILRGADLSDSDLTGAVFDGADVTGVNWGGATCPDSVLSNDFGESCCGHMNESPPQMGCD